MANIVTYDLVECSALYPTLESVENAGLSAYVDLFVEFDGDLEQSYQVRKNDQSRFLKPADPTDPTLPVTFTVTSLIWNGLEAITAQPTTTFGVNDLIHTDFVNYIAAPNGYTAGVANAIYWEQVGASIGNPTANFSQFLQGVFDALGINATVSISHEDWWVADAFPVLENFAIEKWSSDSFDITVTEEINSVVRTLRYVSTGTTVQYYEDGVLWQNPPEPTTELPQYGDAYSFYQNAFSYTSVLQITQCPILSPFYTTLDVNGCTDISIDCDCSRITFGDGSIYNNGLPGHDISMFDFREITMFKPNGEEYVYTTDTTDLDADEYIQPPNNSNNMFTYDIQNDDIDGIYDILICAYPTWQSTIAYDVNLENRVYYNGKFYKQVASSTGQDPELDTTNTYWIELTAAEMVDTTTRYCAKGKIAVICISILKCYRNAVKDAYCGIDNNPCGSFCENEDAMRAMKIIVTLESLEYAICGSRWDLAAKHMEVLNSICCCE